MRRTIWMSLLLAAAVSMGTFAAVKPLYIDDFGAVGDGKQDDVGALVLAIDALKALGPGGTLEFSAGKIYRLGLRDDSIAQIDLQNMTNVTVNGNGSMMLTTPRQAAIRVKRCKGVTVKNLIIEQDPLAFTQGIIERIVPEEAFFEMKIMEGYDLLPSDAERKATGHPGWSWGSILDPKLRRIRWDVRDHFRSTRIEPLGERRYRVFLQQGFVEDLKQVRVGDVFFQPFQYNVQSRLEKIDGGRYAASIHVTNSGDCLIENITLYSGRSSMTSRVDLNYGRITFRGFKVMFRPGTDRVVTNWRDGMHCKDNRIGPIIEDCYFEGMLDDSINLSQNTIMASEIISDTTFRMTKAEGPKRWGRDSSSVWVGDELMVFYPPTGEYIGPITVVHVDENSPEVVTLDRPVENVVPGQIRSVIDKNSTHFYNMNMCNSGFIIRNNTFMPQRRHAMLVRSPNGLIEGNTIEEVGGHGVLLANEYGHFYEGPFPQNIVVRNNKIRNTHLAPICAETHSGPIATRLVKTIEITGNVISSDEPAIRLSNVENITVSGDNDFRKMDGTLMLSPVRVSNSRAVHYISPTAAAQLQDSGFEASFPDPDGNGFQLQLDSAPWDSPWVFNGTAGYSQASTAFTSGNPLSPEGLQVLVLKGRGRVWQELTLDAGVYTLSFYAAQRNNFGEQIQQFEVSFGDILLGVFQPPLDGSYKQYEQTFSWPLRNTCRFDLKGILAGDETVFIDGITLVKKLRQSDGKRVIIK